ncbi:hypothetical protein AAF712_005784 [Marasmius tenuissimus]|uniref:Uncharacterized protein n=1 Tax=Marasmius tenuissimus TaxID=585030 RepID=A0ABR3A1N1_9AGAR
MDLDRYYSPSDSTGSILRDFFTRSSCSLTSLRLHYFPINDEGLLSLLPLLPTPVTPIVDGGVDHTTSTGRTKIITNHLLARLSLYREAVGSFGTDRVAPSAADVLIPHLENLPLCIDDSRGLDEKNLASAIASRLPDIQGREHDVLASDRCLRSIDISLTVRNDDYFDALLSLECFRDAGVKVNITVSRVSSGEKDG